MLIRCMLTACLVEAGQAGKVHGSTINEGRLETVNERMELYDELCAILTAYEDPESDRVPTEECLYTMLVKMQEAFNDGII